jgi:predicted ester cyclase
MSVEDNKAVVQRIIEEAFNQGRLEVVDQVVDSSCGYRLVGNRGQSRQIGPRIVRDIIHLFRTAFPDLHIEIEDQIVKGNQVVTCWCARGTHRGNLLGLAATGRRVSVTGIAITRIVSTRSA